MISANAIEYVTRDLFKGKSLKAACKSFIKKFGGNDAVFVGNVDYTANELAEAVLQDKISKVTDVKFLPGIAMRFNLKPAELEKAFERRNAQC